MGEDQVPPKLVNIAGEFLIKPLAALFRFDKGRWWTTLLEKIFPIFSFSTDKAKKYDMYVYGYRYLQKSTYPKPFSWEFTKNYRICIFYAIWCDRNGLTS